MSTYFSEIRDVPILSKTKSFLFCKINFAREVNVFRKYSFTEIVHNLCDDKNSLHICTLSFVENVCIV